MTGVCHSCIAHLNPTNRAGLNLKQYVRRTRCSCCMTLKFALWIIPRRRRPRRPVVIFLPPIHMVEIPQQRIQNEDHMPERPEVYTYVMDEECPICYEKDDIGHRQCLQCNGSCCNSCWSRVDKCPLCRCDK